MKVVFVLGMHRSGTSLLSAAIESMGFSLGINKTKDKSDENQKGFFENTEIIDFNDTLLQVLNSRWDSCIFEPEKLVQLLNNDREYIEKAKSLVKSEFCLNEPILIKDPRCCLLVPFWEKVFYELGCSSNDLYFVHIFRNAFEVAQSQQTRFNQSDFYSFGAQCEVTLGLWVNYIRNALYSTKEKKNLFLNYSDFFSAPQLVYQKVAEFTCCKVLEQQVIDFSKSFVDTGLYRSKKSEFEEANEYPHLTAAVKQVNNKVTISKEARYQDLLECLETPEVQSELRSIESIYMSTLLTNTIKNKLVAKDKLVQKSAEYERVVNELSEVNTELSKVHDEWVLVNNHLNQPIIKLIRSRILSKIKTSTFLAKCIRLYFLIISKVRPHYSSLSSKYKFIIPLLSPLHKLNRYLRARLYRNVVQSNELKAADGYSKVDKDNSNYQPKVTVIVPNYNHEIYLEERLESIYAQTYQNVEVLLLDDCSSDDSTEILKKYADQYSDKTQLIINEVNSGGVFHQWQKGLSLAQGDLIWIAESDDYCSNDFLAELVDAFRDESVMLAFSNSLFVKDGEVIWSLEDYLSDVSDLDWNSNFIKPAYQLMNKGGFAVKNYIPNVSSALFRKAKVEDVINDTQWQTMSVCGDWVFYSNILRGGCLAYRGKAVNYYRQHDSNTSVKAHKLKVFYEEHNTVTRYNIKNYGLSEALIDAQYQSLCHHLQSQGYPFSIDELQEVYKPDELKALVNKKSKPNILMVGYAFVSGGGETFPIQLANIFKEKGHSVTFLNCNEEKENPGIRAMLRSDIPVVNNVFLLNQVVKDFGIDVIHSHHAWADVSICELLDPKLQCKHVVSMHGMYELMPEKRQKEVLLQLHQRCSKLVYTADKNLAPLKNLDFDNSSKLTKIDNALELKPISKIERSSLGISATSIIFCLVTRAVPDKGWQESIDAIKEAREASGKDLHLVLIGDGPEYERLKFTQESYLHLLGFRSNIRDYFAMADYALLPTRFKGESYPLVLIDAVHSGAPVLASDIGEIKNMMTTKYGLCGDVFSLIDWQIPVSELARKMVMLSEHSKESFESSLKEASIKFSPEKLYENYLASYTF